MSGLILLILSGCRGDEAPAVPSAQDVAIAPTHRLARLTHLQYENTVQDLLGLDEAPGLAETFIGDGLYDGFENNAAALQIGPELWLDYQRASEGLALQVRSDADLYARVVPEDPRSGEPGIAFDALAEGEGPEVDASTGAVDGDSWNLWSNGELSWVVEIPESGRYTLSTRVWADQAGEELALMSMGVDGQEAMTAEVAGTSDGSGEVFEVEVELLAGAHTIYVAFLNDYWVQGVADRNLNVDWIAVTGQSETFGPSQAGPEQVGSWIRTFGLRAFRRPLSADELETYRALFEAGPELVGSGDDFGDGVQVVITAMLQSPYFLYRIEESTEALPDGRIFLSDYEVASKLSYALWNTMPDADLFEAAAAERLRSTADLRTQALRMLEDPRASAMVNDFHRQLLGLDTYENIYKDPNTYPAYTPEMNAWMQTEAAMFTHEMVFGGHGVHALFTAPWTYANAELAAVYGAGPVVDPDADGFGRVDLDPAQRAGLLTQLGFLAVHADLHTESSIHRGVFVNLAMLCVDLPSPPDNIEPLPPPTGAMTNRELIESHTGDGTCGAGCHSNLINPPGFAFEHYDALGQYREQDHGLPVDASGSFSSGEAWEDAIGFAAVLGDSPTAHQCYVQNWMEFLYGRVASSEDEGHLQELAHHSRLEDRAILDLLVDLMVSDAFRMRSSEVQ